MWRDWERYSSIKSEYEKKITYFVSENNLQLVIIVVSLVLGK